MMLSNLMAVCCVLNLRVGKAIHSLAFNVSCPPLRQSTNKRYKYDHICQSVSRKQTTDRYSCPYWSLGLACYRPAFTTQCILYIICKVLAPWSQWGEQPVADYWGHDQSRQTGKWRSSTQSPETRDHHPLPEKRPKRNSPTVGAFGYKTCVKPYVDELGLGWSIVDRRLTDTDNPSIFLLGVGEIYFLATSPPSRHERYGRLGFMMGNRPRGACKTSLASDHQLNIGFQKEKNLMQYAMGCILGTLWPWGGGWLLLL